MTKAIAVVLMGVTGSGKSTVGRILESRLGWPFLDGDDFHPEANVAKMAAGIPLDDDDRWPWLRRLADEVHSRVRGGGSCILGCSALRAVYREVLRGDHGDDLLFVHLDGAEGLIADRLATRVHRYMPATLLRSQFEALEAPDEAVRIDISGTPDEVADAVIAILPAAVEDWQLLDSQQLADYRICRVRRDRRRSPRTGAEHDFYVLQMPEWVNVIAVTSAGTVVVVEQYRHGVEEVVIEIPGGVVDVSDADLAAAARRELLEETGYEAAQVVAIGSVSANPAIQDNRCHTFVALAARKVAAPELDAGEDIAVREVELRAIPQLAASGRMHNAMVIAAFYWFERWRQSAGGEALRASMTPE